MAEVGSKRVARGASHLAKLLAVGDLHEVNAVLRAERLDQLRVRRLVATLRQHAQLPLGLVECLAALVEAAAKAVVAEGVLQDLLQRRLHVHRRLRGSGLRSLHRRVLHSGLGRGHLVLVSHCSSLLSSRDSLAQGVKGADGSGQRSLISSRA